MQLCQETLLAISLTVCSEKSPDWTDTLLPHLLHLPFYFLPF